MRAGRLSGNCGPFQRPADSFIYAQQTGIISRYSCSSSRFSGFRPTTDETLIATAMLMALVMALREPVRRLFGAQVAYALWLLPALRMVLPPLPAAWRDAAATPISARWGRPGARTRARTRGSWPRPLPRAAGGPRRSRAGGGGILPKGTERFGRRRTG